MKFILCAEITVSAYCEVEADTLEEAIEKAEGLQPTYHDPCSGTSPTENWCVDEIDGDPRNIRHETE